VAPLAGGNYLSAFSFGLCGLISLPPVWRALKARGVNIPTTGRIGAIVVLFFLGVTGMPQTSEGSLQRVAENDLSSPDGRAAKLARLQSKIGPDALFEMDYNDREFREAYPKLGRRQYAQSNEMMPWAAVAAGESERCSHVQAVTPSLRATPQALSWTVICMRDGRYQDTFEITPEQAQAVRDKYDPDATVEAREAAMQVATAEPRSARWKNFDKDAERAAVVACRDIVRRAMVNEGSFSSSRSVWNTYRMEDTGDVAIEQDFTAKNAYGGTINSRYRCVVDPDNSTSISEVLIREITGWQKLI